MSEFIGRRPPQDGREWDCQCARCGGEAEWFACELCDDGFDGHDCGEDTCCCLEPEANIPCDFCGGSGGENICQNTRAFCEANPLPGRESIKQGELEWFAVDYVPPSERAKGDADG